MALFHLSVWEEKRLPEETKKAISNFMNEYLKELKPKQTLSLVLLNQEVYQYIRFANVNNYIDERETENLFNKYVYGIKYYD
jgi:hypothetical protein